MNKWFTGLVVVVALGLSLMSGAYFGAYYSDPILSSVIDGQNDRIDNLLDDVDDCDDMNRDLERDIDDLEDNVEDLLYCFDRYDITEKSTADLYEFTECIEEVER